MLNKYIYQMMENVAPHLTLWVALFFIISITRIAINLYNPKKVNGYGSVISELPGLPLIFMHSVGFIKAIGLNDWLSALLFLWWGPGFFIFASIYLYGKIFKKKINWAPFGLITSYACKIDYVIFMAIYWYYDLPFMMFTFSAWIICDQINLAYFVSTADRTRRTFEDFWLLRIMYPGLLFVPLFYPNIAHKNALILFAFGLLIVWIWALYGLYKKGLFFTKYNNPDYLRNIVYLSSRYKGKR